MLTWHNDNARTGQNLQETVLTPANVNSSTFGKLFTLSVDGKVDAQPLYVPSVNISGHGARNVLYVVTENDSAYAFDADNGTQYWHGSLLGANETPSDDRGCGQVTPTIGATATPAIDLSSGAHGTMYTVAMTKDESGNYHHRLHALDLTTGAEEFSGPKEVAATFPGTGAGSSGGTVTFSPAQYKERPGLLILNGVVYTSWGSHCDDPPYTGWVMGYNETTLAQVSVLDLIPNGNYGGIWMAGAGPAADASGNIYLLTGNGTFDTTLSNGFPSSNDFGNAFVKISTSGGSLSVADYFTMDNTVSESGSDTDFGSGGMMLLPPLTGTSGSSVSLAVGAGKDHNIYVVNQANLGKFSSSADNIYQQLSGVMPNGVWSSPAWFNGYLYYGGVGDYVKAFQFTSGLFDSVASSHSPTTFEYPGATPSISANGTSNAIVWAAENSSPAVLHAYTASNLATELYNSNQAANGRDQFGSGNKYIVPTIANGKVYVGTTSGVGVFGLLMTLADEGVTPSSGSGASQTFAFAFTDSNGASDIVSAYMDVNATLVPNSACYLGYTRASNLISLASDAGAWQTGLVVGSTGTSSNSQCTINAGASSVSMAGDTLTLNLALSFASGFAGAKNIYMDVKNASSDSGWSQKGTWTVPAVTSSTPPSAASVTPSSGNGASQTFGFAFTDTNGASDIVTAYVDVNASLVPNSACYLSYTRGSNTISLASDSGTWQSGLTIGSTGTSSNSQCTLNAGASSMSASGDTLTLNLALSFASGFAGGKNIYMDVKNASLDSGWSRNGTWTVPGTPAPTLAAVSVTPSSGSGSSQTFAFAFSDPNGASDIVTEYMDVNASLVPNNACYLSYTRASNTISLASDAGAWQTGLTIGGAGTSSNSQCTINAGASSVSASGNTLTLNLALSFSSGFAGAKNIYMDVKNATLDSNWSQKGTWTVTATGGSSTPPATLSAVSVSPSNGSGASQTFVFTFTDSNGASDIVTAYLDVSARLVPNSACYLSYTRASNQISLASDAGAWQTGLTIGDAGSSGNSQCTINAGASSVTMSGNTLTLNLALSFASGFAGAKNVYMDVKNATLDSGWSQQGAWTVSGTPAPTLSPVSVTPSSGSGAGQTFAFAFLDPNGASDIVAAYMDVNASLVPNSACYLSYTRASNQIALASDAGAWQAGLTVGSAGTSSNSQCAINAGESSVSISGNTLTLNLALSFNAGFAGAKNVYMDVRNATLDSNWSQMGTWTVP